MNLVRAMGMEGISHSQARLCAEINERVCDFLSTKQERIESGFHKRYQKAIR